MSNPLDSLFGADGQLIGGAKPPVGGVPVGSPDSAGPDIVPTVDPLAGLFDTEGQLLGKAQQPIVQGIPVNPTVRGEFRKGLQQHIPQTLGLVQAAAGTIGQVVGADEFAQDSFKRAVAFMDQADEFAPFVGRIEDINDAKTFSLWLSSTLGEGLPTVVEAMASGGVGALLTRKIAEGLITRELSKKAMLKIAEIGATAGMVTYSGISGTGEAAQ